ncbi:MAG: Holliday junction ATP-dependent DNA helicase RuvA [bacterium ADurb.Bin400]|nr:MAG: Holliday junction ATP-dependent DNA helicase RuvA [bacterium ADurb.Bin400]
MISYISGRVVFVRGGAAIIDTGGVGYKIFAKIDDSFSVGAAKTFFTHHHIREDSQDLYGFETHDELELFQKLISVNGVGPKAAMVIMSAGSVENIVSAIVGDNLSFFVAIPGIGKKVAAKIVLELKSKVAGIESTSVLEQMDISDEVVDALVALGYKRFEISKVVSKAPSDLASVEDRIRWCLKNLAK